MKNKSKGLVSIFTKEKLIDLYFNEKLSFEGIARRYGCVSSNIAYYFRKFGIKGRVENGSFIGGIPWNKNKSVKNGTITNKLYLDGIRSTRKYGSDHPMYKGGWMQGGYKWICIRGKDMAEHTHLIKEHLGRELLDNEVVHHINKNKLDNSPENLMILTRAEHMNIHRAEIVTRQYD